MKSALVTGASSGIGRVFVEKLAAAGYKVTGVARNESQLKEVFGPLGTEHGFLVADLSTEAGQEKIARVIADKKFNLLINNAGVGTTGLFSEIAIEKQMGMLHLNIQALTKLSHVYLKNAKSGDALINVSSALAFMPMPSMALYAATKAFVTSLSDALWFEYKEKGIYVMGLCPGITDTNFTTSAGGHKEDLPKGQTQTPEEVVTVALKALIARANPTVVSGFKNVMFAGMSRILPRRAIVNMTGGMMPKR